MNKSSLSNRGHGTGYQPRRSLADLLSAHGEKGRENVESLHITEDEEDMLREALDNWVSSARKTAKNPAHQSTFMLLFVDNDDNRSTLKMTTEASITTSLLHHGVAARRV